MEAFRSREGASRLMCGLQLAHHLELLRCGVKRQNRRFCSNWGLRGGLRHR